MKRYSYKILTRLSRIEWNGNLIFYIIIEYKDFNYPTEGYIFSNCYTLELRDKSMKKITKKRFRKITSWEFFQIDNCSIILIKFRNGEGEAMFDNIEDLIDYLDLVRVKSDKVGTLLNGVRKKLRYLRNKKNKDEIELYLM